MTAAIYARFSSDRQTEMSIEAQIRACKEYAIKANIDIINEYVDEAVSGKTNKRAAYQRMLRDAKKNKFDIILIHKYDRIARNLGEHVNLSSKLEELGVSLIAVAQDFGDGKEGKLMRSIQWVLSEYYIDNLAEETRKGQKEIALRGLHNGGVPPFGYDVQDQKYVINPVEASYVQRLFNACILGNGYKDILKEMEDLGIVGKRGKTLKSSSVTEILHNEKYTGTYLYSLTEEKERSKRRTKPNAIRIEDAFPAIVSKEVFDEAQRIMEQRQHNGHAKHRCSGLIYCAECGSKMHLLTTRKNGHEYHYFNCSNHCGGNVKVELVDEAVNYYLSTLLTEENKTALTAAVNNYAANETKMQKEFEATRKAKIEAKQAEIDSLMANLTSGVLPKPILDEISRKMEALIQERDRIEKLQPQKHYTREIVASWLESVCNATDEALPSVLIDRITVSAKKSNDPEIVIESTLSESLGDYGCGGCQPYIPTIWAYMLIKASQLHNVSS